jgi:hypothetical protein
MLYSYRDDSQTSENYCKSFLHANAINPKLEKSHGRDAWQTRNISIYFQYTEMRKVYILRNEIF